MHYVHASARFMCIVEQGCNSQIAMAPIRLSACTNSKTARCKDLQICALCARSALFMCITEQGRNSHMAMEPIRFEHVHKQQDSQLQGLVYVCIMCTLCTMLCSWLSNVSTQRQRRSRYVLSTCTEGNPKRRMCIGMQP